MWAVMRLLLASGGKLDEKAAKLLLTPPSLTAGENDEYDVAVKTLAELGIVTAGWWNRCASTAKPGRCPSTTSRASTALLRRAALDPARNVGLAETDDLGGPKDLVRALAWFLTQDPATPLDWDGGRRVSRMVPSPAICRRHSRIASRWDRFVYWGPALGLRGSATAG